MLLNDPLYCHPCSRIFKTSGGLTKHLVTFHSQLPNIHILARMQGLHLGNVETHFDDPGYLDDPGELDGHGEPSGDIDFNTVFSSNPDTAEYNPNDSDSDNDGGLYMTLETENFIPEQIDDWDVSVHLDGGYIIDSGINTLDPCNHDLLDNAKYHPWVNADELWLTNFIFTKAKMSSRVANSLLNMFTIGQLHMQQPICFGSVHKMYRIMDTAEYSLVSFAVIATMSCLSPSLHGD